MQNKKRESKLKGRILCHGNKSSCVQLFKEEHHRPLGKKTAKGTKPIKKQKKIYEKK
jgi:hypothetical protein